MEIDEVNYEHLKSIEGVYDWLPHLGDEFGWLLVWMNCLVNLIGKSLTSTVWRDFARAFSMTRDIGTVLFSEFCSYKTCHEIISRLQSRVLRQLTGMRAWFVAKIHDYWEPMMWKQSPLVRKEAKTQFLSEEELKHFFVSWYFKLSFACTIQPSPQVLAAEFFFVWNNFSGISVQPTWVFKHISEWIMATW